MTIETTCLAVFNQLPNNFQFKHWKKPAIHIQRVSDNPVTVLYFNMTKTDLQAHLTGKEGLTLDAIDITEFIIKSS